jgi:hypothetical protein
MPTSLHLDTAGNHIHSIASEDLQLVRTESFDFHSVYRNVDGEEEPEDTMVSMADLSGVFSLIMEAILKADNLTMAGAHAAALGVFLDPVHNDRFGSNLAEIAREAGCTRAALSKFLMDFRRAVGIHLTAGKRSGASESYRQAQRDCIAAKTHSSFTRKDRIDKRAA